MRNRRVRGDRESRHVPRAENSIWRLERAAATPFLPRLQVSASTFAAVFPPIRPFRSALHLFASLLAPRHRPDSAPREHITDAFTGVFKDTGEIRIPSFLSAVAFLLSDFCVKRKSWTEESRRGCRSSRNRATFW